MATLPHQSWSVASIREISGVSLEEIARNTKLRVTTLKAIEDAHFDELPGGIYNISYIRQYARAIGADAVLAASVFHFGALTVRGVKDALHAAGFPVRLPQPH